MIRRKDTKRGDTIIEVMFAIAIFGLVAILSIASMNRGVITAETTLETTTAREELNAQAEALRFMHISLDAGGMDLWNELTRGAISADAAQKSGLTNLAEYIVTPDANGLVGCDKIYESTDGPEGKVPLEYINAFVINTRKFNVSVANQAYFGYNDGNNSDKFQASPLGARILWTTDDTENGSNVLSDTGITLGDYSEIEKVEGIWAFAVKSSESSQADSSKPLYYDFYVEACWYGSGAKTPTVLDTVIRLNNPRTR